jgi:CRISPR-associated endonuclease Cas2
MRRRRTWLVGYDIASPRRLRRVAKLLERHAVRVQYSLFAASWTDAEFDAVWRQLAGIINARCDDVRAWPLAENASVEVWGMGWAKDVVVFDARTRPLGRLLGLDGEVEVGREDVDPPLSPQEAAEACEGDREASDFAGL